MPTYTGICHGVIQRREQHKADKRLKRNKDEDLKHRIHLNLFLSPDRTKVLLTCQERYFQLSWSRFRQALRSETGILTGVAGSAFGKRPLCRAWWTFCLEHPR